MFLRMLGEYWPWLIDLLAPLAEGQRATCIVVLGFNATLTAKVISWQSMMHKCFLALLYQYEHNFLS